MLVLLLTAWSTAHAQVPGLSLGAPMGDVRWVVSDVESKRFPAGATTQSPGPSLRTGEEVELIVVDGSRARIKKGDRYGWVPATALTEEAPASAALPPLGADALLGQPLLGAPSLEAPPNIGAGMGAGGTK